MGELELENKMLRELLWFNHGHKNLYGDDGEIQCAECGLDFKRDLIETITEVLATRGSDETFQEARRELEIRKVNESDTKEIKNIMQNMIGIEEGSWGWGGQEYNLTNLTRTAEKIQALRRR